MVESKRVYRISIKGLTEPVEPRPTAESPTSSREMKSGEESGELVINNKVESEPEDLSQADSDESDKKVSAMGLKSEPAASDTRDLTEVNLKDLFDDYGPSGPLNNFCPSRFSQVCSDLHFLQIVNLDTHIGSEFLKCV